MFSTAPGQTGLTATAPRSGLLLRVAGFVARGLKRAWLWPARVIEARREMAVFARMSDHDLRDIGLSRIDVSNASALEPDQLPSTFLGMAAHELRVRRRGGLAE